MARGKVLVTGGTSGIGKATVRLLASEGYQVHFTYRSSEGTAQELEEEEFPDKAFAHKLDQGDSAAIDAAGFLLEHEWTGVVFNAALGSATVKAYVDDEGPLNAATDTAMLTVNALGPLWLYRKLEPALKAKAAATKLVFLSSVGGGLAAFPGFDLSDGMSKAAVTALARQLAAENVHTPIDVFCICPGAVDTPMFQKSTLHHMSEGERASFEASQGKGRLIQPEEVAQLIVKLMEDDSRLLHGAVIDATAGLGVRPGMMTELDIQHG